MSANQSSSPGYRSIASASWPAFCHCGTAHRHAIAGSGQLGVAGWPTGAARVGKPRISALSCPVSSGRVGACRSKRGARVSASPGSNPAAASRSAISARAQPPPSAASAKCSAKRRRNHIGGPLSSAVTRAARRAGTVGRTCPIRGHGKDAAVAGDEFSLLPRTIRTRSVAGCAGRHASVKSCSLGFPQRGGQPLRGCQPARHDTAAWTQQ